MTSDTGMTGSVGVRTPTDRTQAYVLPQREKEGFAARGTGTLPGPGDASFSPVVQFQQDSFQATNLTVQLQVSEFIQLDFTVSVQRSSTLGVNLNFPLDFYIEHFL